MYSHLSVGLFWFVLFQLRGLKERIPPLQGATLQLLGQALCGGSPSLCFYLQQWQRSCRKRNHKLIHSSGGIQWGSTGNGKGQSESYCLFTHTAGTLQVVIHTILCVISGLRKMHLCLGECLASDDSAHRVPSLFRVSYVLETAEQETETDCCYTPYLLLWTCVGTITLCVWVL